MVQDILSDISGDEINSIDDTAESERIVGIIEGKFNAMASNRNWPHQKKLLNLTARSDSNFPTHMRVEDKLKEVISIYYDTAKAGSSDKSYTKIYYKDPDEFIMKTNFRRSSSPEVQTVIDDTGVELFITNNQPPTFYTSFNDIDIVMDSFDNTVDSTLQASKTQALGYVMSEFSRTDDYEIDMPAEAIPALLEQCKSTAQWKIRQIQDPDAEVEARRQQRWLANKAFRMGGGIKTKTFGRKR